MRLRSVMIVMVVVLSAFTNATRAWNDTGHMTVALIAYRQLDDATKAKVGALLKAHPHYTLYLSAYKPEGVAEDEWAFLRGAAWSDFIRPARPGSDAELYKGPEVTKFHQPYWHYITIPWVPPFERSKVNATTLPSRTEPNALTAMEAQSKVLADAGAKIEDRAVALTWLEHLIGDIHQPLHAANCWSSQYPQGDKGGNEMAVRTNGEAVRLHSYWDAALGTSDAYDAVAFLADEITSDPQLARDKLPELAKDTTFNSWIEESHRWAIALAYLNGRLKTVPWAALDAKQITVNEVPALPASYAGNARDLSKRRVALAGYRLADRISQLLKD